MTSDKTTNAAPVDGIVIRKQVIMLAVNGRKPIPLETKDAVSIISELAEAIAHGRDCEIEV